MGSAKKILTAFLNGQMIQKSRRFVYNFVVWPIGISKKI